MQDEYDEVFYSVADLHALTAPTPISKKKTGQTKDSNKTATPGLAEASRATVCSLLASGIDPSKSTLFVQSAGDCRSPHLENAIPNPNLSLTKPNRHQSGLTPSWRGSWAV